MSTAPLSICAECQLLHCLPALNVNCKEGYLRWASLDKWQSHSSRCQCPGSFQNDTWIREFDWWWVRGSKSPSGSKNLQVDSRTEVGEDTSQLHASLKLTHPFSKTPIYRALSWGLRRLDCIAKNCCWFVVGSLGVYALKGAEEGIPFYWEGDAGLEPYVLYLFLNLVINQ